MIYGLEDQKELNDTVGTLSWFDLVTQRWWVLQCPNAHHLILLTLLLPFQFVFQGPGLEMLGVWQGLHLPLRWQARVYQRVLVAQRWIQTW